MNGGFAQHGERTSHLLAPSVLVLRTTDRLLTQPTDGTHLVDFRDDERHVGVEAEGGGVVDHHGAVLYVCMYVRV